MIRSISKIPSYVTPSYGVHDGIGGSLLSFLQLVRQRSSGNQLQQCPCVHLPGSDKCIAYDSRYLATTVEEAILTFVDQTMDPRIYEQRTGGPIVSQMGRCFICGRKNIKVEAVFAFRSTLKRAYSNWNLRRSFKRLKRCTQSFQIFSNLIKNISFLYIKNVKKLKILLILKIHLSFGCNYFLC